MNSGAIIVKLIVLLIGPAVWFLWRQYKNRKNDEELNMVAANKNDNKNQEINSIKLKNGTVRNGYIIEKYADDSIKIKTLEGFFYIVNKEDIESITNIETKINSDKNLPNTKKCPYCKEEINKDAIKCKYCGEYLNIKEKSQGNKQKNKIPIWILILLGIILLILGGWDIFYNITYIDPNYLLNQLYQGQLSQGPDVLFFKRFTDKESIHEIVFAIRDGSKYFGIGFDNRFYDVPLLSWVLGISGIYSLITAIKSIFN